MPDYGFQKSKYSIYFALLFALGIYGFGALRECNANPILFSQPTIVPIATWVGVDIDATDNFIDEILGPKDDYQFRYVELLNEHELRITGAYEGQRSPADANLIVNLVEVAKGLNSANPMDHSLVLFPEFLDEEPCMELASIEKAVGGIKQFRKYISTETYVLEEVCNPIPAIATNVTEGNSDRDYVRYNKNGKRINVQVAGEIQSFDLDPNVSLNVAHDGLGIIGKTYPTSSNTMIVSLEIENSFWGVFALEQDGLARLLLGPEQTASNRGFIPRSLALAPKNRPWMAYIGPLADSGLWGISVWDIEDQHKPARLIASFADGQVAYSEHRGFDHAVSWTGPDSLIYLKADELTLRHISISKHGGVKTLGEYSFNRGTKLTTTGQIAGIEWVQKFDLFRIEAISALPLNDDSIRVACVAVLRFQSENKISQIALPLVVDLPWNLKSNG